VRRHPHRDADLAQATLETTAERTKTDELQPTDITMPPSPMRLQAGDALVVVDVQRDFCSGGALAIAGADEIVPMINDLIKEAVETGALVVASRDWHPPNHSSFHPSGGPWPEHCLQGSDGAKFHVGLRLPGDTIMVAKGEKVDKDQYSAFDTTGLAGELRSRGVKRVLICGLARDVCVRATALDAVDAGFETHVQLSATRPVTSAGGKEAVAEMVRAGVIVEGV
jgi:nicotinamidase/pyrazinamidase